MRKGAAILLAVLLLATLPLCAYADGQRLLYPGMAVEDSRLTVMTVPMSSGTVDVATGSGTVGGDDCGTRAEANLGLTFYCVMDNSRSFSNYQKEQQRLGLLALSNALSPADSMVLITMGREVSFGEKLTDPAQREAAIEAACTYDAIGTNLYEAINTVLSTIAEQETGFACVFVFTDGIDDSPVVKFNEDQVERIVAGSGMCVNFVALLTPPVTGYASSKAQLMERFAAASLGGTCRTPLQEGDGSVGTVEQAVQEMVSATTEWRVLRLNTDEIPRTDRTVALSLTWKNEGSTITDTLTLDTSTLPPLPEPPTEPPTLPPTEPPETIPPITQPVETIPEYFDEHADDMRYYAMIGFGVIGVLIVLAIVIVVTDRHQASRKDAPGKEKSPTPPPAHPEGDPVPPEKQEAPEILKVPEAPESTPAPTAETPAPPQEAPEAKPAVLPPEKDETPAQPEQKPEAAPKQEPENEPEIEPEAAPEEQTPPPAAPRLSAAEDELTAFLQGKIDLDQFLNLNGTQEKAPEQPAPEQPQRRRKPAAPPPTAVTEEWDLTGELDEEQRKEQSAPRSIFGHREREPKPEKQRDSLHQSVSALRAAQRRSTQEELLQAARPPAPPAPGRPGSCTVRLTPEGNPAGTVYVTMEPGGSRTLGRNGKSNVILNPKDSALSGLHFELQWDGHVLYLTDCGSTNGTSLTGIPQRPGHWSKVEPGTTLQAGSVRYKVKITKN